MTVGPEFNPFALPEDPGRADPPLDCASHDGPACHLDVGGAKRNFERFEQRLKSLGCLQSTGLFVAVSGPSRCGKTSLINRCVAHATAAFNDQGIRVEKIDLTPVRRQPNLTVSDRTRRVGRLLADNLKRMETIFDPRDFTPPEATGDGEPDLADWTTQAHPFLNDNSVAIILTPSTEHFDEIATYWSGVYPRMLVFTECPLEDLADDCRGTLWEMHPMAQWICLETRQLTPLESRRFIKARTDVGNGERFPNLSEDALEEGIFGGKEPVGAAQKLLYEFAEYCLRNGTTNVTLGARDLRRFIENSPPGQMG